MSKTSTETLAAYAVQTSSDFIPEVVKDRTRQVIFDEIACAHFGRRSDAGALAAQYASMFAGPEESRILGSNLRVSAAYAALANGTAGHGEEVDGAHIVGGHPGASIVHAAVAMAERQHASGAELLNAVALGYDVGTRIVQACGGKFVVRKQHHLTSDLFYAYGATVSAGRLLRLDPVRHCHALALVSFQTNGLYALYAEKRHISKSFCNGQYAFAGISAALMALIGLEGNEDIIGAKDGLLEAWATDTDRHAITHALGEYFAIMGANFKFLNAGYPIHTPVEATMRIIAAHSIDLEAIDSIQIGMPLNSLITVDNRKMHNICVQDMVTASVVSGGLKLDDLPFPAMLENPNFRRLRPRVIAVVDDNLEREQPDGRGANVMIRLTDDTSFSLRVDHPLGHSARGGTTWEALFNKWNGVLANCDVSQAIEAARRLDDITDVRQFTALFEGPRIASAV